MNLLGYIKNVIIFAFCMHPFTCNYAGESDKDMTYFNITLLDILDIEQDEETQPLVLYGFIRTNVEQVFDIPFIGENGRTEKGNDPLEWSNPNFNLYGISKINDRFDIGFNIFAEDSDFELKNAWGNIRYNESLQFKIGKQYRRFGLFNEKLDETPTFIGIEPPELLDGDHLLLPRTTRFMIHGIKEFEGATLLYSVDTDNAESGPERDVFPIGWDVRYKTSTLVVGLSGFSSTLAEGDTTSTTGVGGGSPKGGVLPWMSGDDYFVIGGFFEKSVNQWLVQGAYWVADHDATRDPSSVLTVIANANINSDQCQNFVGQSDCSGIFSESDIITKADYKVKTAYLRIGYTFQSTYGPITPYFHYDWMNHPETIQSKTYGGDNESGFSDDGDFVKYSIGVVYNPLPEVAIKLDSSAHVQDFNGSSEIYPEIRLDVSYAFKM